MSHKVETMAYANQVPWHGLGFKVNDNLTPAQMLKAAKIDWTVSKHPVYKKVGEKFIVIPGEFDLRRDDNDATLSIVGRVFKPIQNEVTLDFFKKFVAAGKMKMETAGSLWDGRYIWALAKLAKSFTLGKTDTVDGHLLIMQPHVLGKAMVMQFTPIRVVCWNTLNFALGSNLKGDGTGFRVPHSVEFNDDVRKQAEEALGLASHQMEEFHQAATLLAKKKAPEKEVEQFFCEVLQWDPKKAEKKKDGEVREPRMIPKFREALTHAPGQALNTAAGTWWGAVNAVSYVVDHDTGNERSTALRTAWLGFKAGVKRRAVDLALKKAA